MAERSKARRTLLIAQGLCVDCKEPAAPRTRCQDCRTIAKLKRPRKNVRRGPKAGTIPWNKGLKLAA